MQLSSLKGKLGQLRRAPFNLWPEFVFGWLRRGRAQVAPCLFPGCSRVVRVPLRDFYKSHFYFCENVEGRNELGYFIDRTKLDDVIYDIGGFRGAYSAAAKAKWGDAVAVHIFEPLAPNFESLQAMAALNSFSRFQINRLAAGDGRPVVGSVNNDDVMLRLGDTGAVAPVEFNSISVDEYIAAGNPPPSILKIDVDGFELQVLNGARNCLQQRRPRLWLEVHPTFLKNQGKSADDLVVLLKENGYALSYFSDYSPNNEISYHVWCE